MITVLHGDNTTESRNQFLELKKRQKNNISFTADKFSITDIVQNVEGSGLFGDIKDIFIEDLLSKSKKTDKESKEIIAFIAKNSKNSTFILWESKEITKRELSIFKDAVIKIYKLPKNIFLFLDNLKPNNSNNLLKLYHQALDSGIKEELILFMIQRQIRILLALSDQGEKLIDELSRLAPWQTGKLQSQSRLFETSHLKKIYKKLYDIELGQKTGKLIMPLSQTIDFLLLDI
ncbi:MAG: hypothetical protein Q8P26_05265 [Candidatus Levybacteria bacterium]|nr:hypothetical protein [Candidatus Levybacteria bacterium]